MEDNGCFQTAMKVLAVVLLFAALFAGAVANTAPERECSSCGRWSRWWGTRCPHCGAQG